MSLHKESEQKGRQFAMARNGTLSQNGYGEQLMSARKWTMRKITKVRVRY
jgi:hypothetical protein